MWTYNGGLASNRDLVACQVETSTAGRPFLYLTTLGIRKCVPPSMIDDDGRNDGYRKKDEVDEEFHCHILFNEPNERHDGIADEAKNAVEESLRSKEKDMIENAAVVPKGAPDLP
jgi:hypothetical protein